MPCRHPLYPGVFIEGDFGARVEGLTPRSLRLFSEAWPQTLVGLKDGLIRRPMRGRQGVMRRCLESAAHAASAPLGALDGAQLQAVA
jgi:hypothetical protein